MRLGNDFFAMLGFAAKARALAFGAGAVESGVKSGRAKLVIIDEALSAASKKSMKDMCAYYRVQMAEAGPAGKLGASCGKGEKKIVGVMQKGFADRLIEILKHSESCSEV